MKSPGGEGWDGLNTPGFSRRVVAITAELKANNRWNRQKITDSQFADLESTSKPALAECSHTLFKYKT